MPIFNQENVNIYIKPEVRSELYRQVTIGDLHSNAMKLMFFLVREGIVEISKENYDSLVGIYNKPSLTKGDLEIFDKIIDGLNVNNKVLVRLIGDELADRGQNDYFILKIIEKLSKDGIELEILLSNHGMEFICAYESGFERLDLSLQRQQARSMYEFYNFFQAKDVKQSQNQMEKSLAEEIVANHYIPYIKAITYSLSEDGGAITIYSHAPIGMTAIQYLAEKLEVGYKDNDLKALVKTIDQINQKLQVHLQQKKIHEIYTDELIYRNADKESKAWLLEYAKLHKYYNPTDNPLNPLNVIYYIIWNREVNGVVRKSIFDEYNLNFVHGHDNQVKSTKNCSNLDGLLGKSLGRNEGKYIVFASNDFNLLNDFLSVSKEDTSKRTTMELLDGSYINSLKR